MAHVDYKPQLRVRFSDTLERVIPLDMGGCNFATFGGIPEQRADVAVQTVARYCGRCGILLLINDNSENYLEAQLQAMPAALPDSHGAYRNTRVSTLSWQDYDFLYGLDENAITNLVLSDQNIHSYGTQANILAGLQAYLRIMQTMFEENNYAFGDYPFNMHLLHQLTQMPYEELKRRVVQYLPAYIRVDVNDAISKENVQTDVHAMVKRFVQRFKRFGFVPSDFGEHSRRSIIQAMAQREILCLRIPGSSEALMEYVAEELKQLREMGIAHMAISCDLNLTRCEALQDHFLSKPPQNVYTGVLSEGISEVAPQARQEAVFSNYPQILVFRCATTSLAEPFANNCDRYKRQEVHKHHAFHLAPMHILPALVIGKDKVLVDEQSVTPGELTKLGDGVLVFGMHYQKPIKIINLRRNGGF